MAGELWRRLCGKAIQPHTHTLFTFSVLAFWTQQLRLNLSSVCKTCFVWGGIPTACRSHARCLHESCHYYLHVVRWKQICLQRTRRGRKVILGLGLKPLPTVQYETKTSYSILRQDVCVFYKKTWHFLSTDSSNKSSSLGVKKWLWELSGSRK